MYLYNENSQVIKEFRMAVKKTFRKQVIWGFLLGIIAIIGMAIYSMFEDVPVVAMVLVGVMMTTIIVFIAIRTYIGSMKHFEGFVYKTKMKKHVHDDNKDNSYHEVTYKYYIYVRKSTGGKVKYLVCETKKPSQRGDFYLSYYDQAQVKKYPGVDLPERFDKPEGQRLCIICGTLSESGKFCMKCGGMLA